MKFLSIERKCKQTININMGVYRTKLAKKKKNTLAGTDTRKNKILTNKIEQ